MKLAVMQPYFFPYIGYFQLIHAVDLFVTFDDVAFIKKGWINRNFLLIDCHPRRFTVPLCQVSQNRSICETRPAAMPWQSKLLKTLRNAYGKAPHFEPVYSLAETVIKEECASVAELATRSLIAVMDYLGLSRKMRSSRTYDNVHLKGQERILDICERENAKTYINLPGGRELYDRDTFLARGLELRFLDPGDVRYSQFRCEFVPNLSILDVLMFNDIAAVRSMLAQADVV
jgi:hypothetical protein